MDSFEKKYGFPSDAPRPRVNFDWHSRNTYLRDGGNRDAYGYADPVIMVCDTMQSIATWADEAGVNVADNPQFLIEVFDRVEVLRLERIAAEVDHYRVERNEEGFSRD